MKMKTAKNKIVFLMKVISFQKLIKKLKKKFSGFNIKDRNFNRHIKLLLQRHYLIKQ